VPVPFVSIELRVEEEVGMEVGGCCPSLDKELDDDVGSDETRVDEDAFVLGVLVIVVVGTAK
jgi:hypothetical protein